MKERQKQKRNALSTRETPTQAEAKFSLRNLRSPVVTAEALTLASGECVALMGASGSGKSRLLRAIVDLEPNEGEVTLDGRSREAFAAPEWRRAVAYVPAESGWWDEQVAPHFPTGGLSPDGLAAVGLPETAGQWQVARLSTGERQRLALLRALAHAPQVLLLDEPTSGLDAEAAGKVESQLQEELSRGVAILLVTHDPAQADRLARRCYRMVAGRLEEVPDSGAAAATAGP